MEVTKEQLIDIIKEKLDNLSEVTKLPLSQAPKSAEEIPASLTQYITGLTDPFKVVRQGKKEIMSQRTDPHGIKITTPRSLHRAGGQTVPEEERYFRGDTGEFEKELEEAKITKSRMIEIIGKQLDEVIENFFKK